MERRLIIVLGTGHCGIEAASDVLGIQRNVSVANQEFPVLPWSFSSTPGLPEGRLSRIARENSATVYGDCNSSYLPHVDAILKLHPDARFVCMERSRNEVVAAFEKQLDEDYPSQCDHWSEPVRPGTLVDPVRRPTFPKYRAESRREAIGLYWDEYNRRAKQLTEQFGRNFRVFDPETALNTIEGLNGLLDFVGVAAADRDIRLGRWGANVDSRPKRTRPRAPRPSPSPHDPRRCVVLVPYTTHIVPQCDEALRELERRGYPVRRVVGFAAIDQGRNQMATDALIDGFDETFWIDADIGFHPDAVDQIRAHNLPICSGIYSQKGKRAIASHILPGTPSLEFGETGGLIDLLYAATGFLHVRRSVYLAVQSKLGLPVCNERFRSPMIPFFQPMQFPIDDGTWYLAEDYAFSQRIREAGYKITADTRIRLWHFGTFGYGWEDAGQTRERFPSFNLKFGSLPE